MTSYRSYGWRGRLWVWISVAVKPFWAWQFPHWNYWHYIYCEGRIHNPWPVSKFMRQEEAYTSSC